LTDGYVHSVKALLRFALAASLLCTAGAARADGVRALGKLEQESVDDVLAAQGLAVDPHPEGKIIGSITVVNQEVFSRRDWWFQWFNRFHWTTRPYILERELLMKPGQPYDEELVQESLRNLQSPQVMIVAGKKYPQEELSSVIAIVAIRDPRPGVVDLLMVTRDTWSLRFNTNFEFQQNTLSQLETSLSENNFLGRRKFLSMGFDMDLGRFTLLPAYKDPNIMGTRLQLVTAVALYYTRGTFDYEGNSEVVGLHYPLYSLASRWGWGLDVVHSDAVVRAFQGTGLLPVNVLVPPPARFGPAGQAFPPANIFAIEPVPYIYRRKIATVDASVVRQQGISIIQQLTGGYLVDVRSSETVPLASPPSPGYAVNPEASQAFLQQRAPISETRSEPYIQYGMFTPRYTVFRDLDTFDLRENRQLGPSAGLRLSYGVPALGADFAGPGFSAAAGWAVAPHGGFASVSLTAMTRLRDGVFIDRRLTATAFAASPIFRNVARVIVEAETSAARNDTARTLYIVGGDTGLRGYAIGAFSGPTAFVGHVEVRSAPVGIIFSQRVGGLLFYDVGDAAPTYASLIAYHDFGVGLRWLSPQFNSSVIRLDWAIATQDAPLTRAGLPGRVTAGFMQVF
jgi:hypothetical protein